MQYSSRSSLFAKIFLLVSRMKGVKDNLGSCVLFHLQKVCLCTH